MSAALETVAPRDPAVMSPREIISAVTEAWVDHLRSAKGDWAKSVRHHCWASARKSCVRQMCLDLLHPEDRPEIKPDSLERMARGDDKENAIIARLIQIGPRCNPPFKAVETQRRFEVKDRDGTLLMSGKTDLRLDFGYGIKPVAEIKSGLSYQNARCLEDLDEGEWTGHAADQLLSYLLAFDEPVGFFIIDRPGLPTLIPVLLMEHLDRAEGFLKDARVAVDASHGGELPPFTTDSSLCRRCDHFGKSCMPPISYTGATVVSDEDLIQLAIVREKNEPSFREYQAADVMLKERLRGCEWGILGPFEVKGKWGKSTSYPVPEKIKEEYKKVDPKGKFTLSLERVIEDESPANPAVQPVGISGTD